MTVVNVKLKSRVIRNHICVIIYLKMVNIIWYHLKHAPAKTAVYQSHHLQKIKIFKNNKKIQKIYSIL